MAHWVSTASSQPRILLLNAFLFPTFSALDLFLYQFLAMKKAAIQPIAMRVTS